MTALDVRTAPAEPGTQLDLVVETNGHTGDLTGVLALVETTELHVIEEAGRPRDGEEILAVAKFDNADPFDRYLKRVANRLGRKAWLAERLQNGTRAKEREAGKLARMSLRMSKNRAALRRQLRRRETTQLLASLYELYSSTKKPRVRKMTGAPAYLSMGRAVWRRFFKRELAKQLRGQTTDLHAAVNNRFHTLAPGMSPQEMRRKLDGIEMVPVKRRRLWQDEAAHQKRKRFVRPNSPTAGHEDPTAWHEIGLVDSQEDYAHAVGRCAYAPKCRYITADGREWTVRMRRRSVISDRWIHWIQEQKRVRQSTTLTRNRRKPIRVHSHSGVVPECLDGEIRQLMLEEDLVRTESGAWFVGAKPTMPRLQVSHLGLIPAVVADYLADATPLGAKSHDLVVGLGGTVRDYADNPFVVAAPFAGYDADAMIRQDQVWQSGAFALEALAIANHLTAELLRLAEVSLDEVLMAPELPAIWQSDDHWVYELYDIAREYPEMGIRAAAVQFLTQLVESLDLIALWDQDEDKLNGLLDRAEYETVLTDRCEQFYNELLASDVLAGAWDNNREKVYDLLAAVELRGASEQIMRALRFAQKVIKPTKVALNEYLARNLTPAQGATVANVYPTMAFTAGVLGMVIKSRGNGQSKPVAQELVSKAEAYAKALLMSNLLPRLLEIDQEIVMGFLRTLANYGGDLREGAMGFHRSYVAKQAAVA